MKRNIITKVLFTGTTVILLGVICLAYRVNLKKQVLTKKLTSLQHEIKLQLKTTQNLLIELNQRSDAYIMKNSKDNFWEKIRISFSSKLTSDSILKKKYNSEQLIVFGELLENWQVYKQSHKVSWFIQNVDLENGFFNMIKDDGKAKGSWAFILEESGERNSTLESNNQVLAYNYLMEYFNSVVNHYENNSSSNRYLSDPNLIDWLQYLCPCNNSRK